MPPAAIAGLMFVASVAQSALNRPVLPPPAPVLPDAPVVPDANDAVVQEARRRARLVGFAANRRRTQLTAFAADEPAKPTTQKATVLG